MQYNPDILEFLELGLSAHGFRCVSTGDGEEGARLALGGDVDIALLDVMLLEIDGLEVSQRIGERRLVLPIPMLTPATRCATRSAPSKGAPTT